MSQDNKIKPDLQENKMKKNKKQQTELEYCCKHCKKQAESNLVGLDSLTIHGLPRVISSPSGIVKICWFLLFACSVYFMGNSFLSAFNKFWSQPSYTNSQWLFNDQKRFPSITICNMRTRTIVSSHNSNYTVSPQDPVVWLDNFLLNSSVLKRVAFNQISSSFVDIIEILPEFCFFGTLQQPCLVKWWKVSSMAPDCVVFNPDGLLTQNNIGQNNGLQLLLYLKSKEGKSYTHHGEIIVSVDYPDVFPDFWSNVFYLELGFSSQIQLVKKHRKLVKGCSDEFSQPHLPGIYDQSICLTSCIIRKTYMKCGDILPEYRQFIGYDLLPKLNIVENTSLCINKIVEEGVYKYVRLCDCKPACNSTSYDMSSFSSNWISNEKVAMVREKMHAKLDREFSENDVRSNFAILNIYFNSLRHFVEEETLAIGWVDFVTDIGGIMGLYIGASIFSLLECTFVMIMYIFVLPKKIFRHAKKKIKKKRAKQKEVHPTMCYPLENQQESD